MSCENTNARLQIKYTTIAGQVPTIPSTNDHNDGTWNPTDIYIGEFFLNSQDDLLWVRTLDGILAVGGTGGSASFIGDFVSKANGGTYSGPVFAPTFSAINMIATTISATAIDATIFGSTGSTYYGDGSNLTGITTNWNGGTVSDPTQFDNTVDFNQDISVSNVYAGTLGYIDIHSDIIVDGGLSASYFVGDGSLLTNLPIGPTANDYTTNAYLDGNIIRYDRTDLADAYSVDLTPILFTQSVASFDWNSSTNDATITINDGSFFTINLGIFNNISTAIINASDVYATNFYGTFNGTFSNDIYTTSASLVGTTAVFDRTDGITYSLDLSTLSGGGSGSVGPTGATGATGAQGYRAVMNLSYTGSSLTLGLGTITLPIGVPINNLGWQQGTRVRVFNDATHYMEGQVTSVITNPQTVGINVNIDYVVGSGSFVAWYVGIAGDLGSGSGGGTQSLEQTLVIGNTTGTQSIYISSSASQIQGYNGINQHWYNSANSLGGYLATETGTGASGSYIRLYEGRGDTHIYNNRYYNTAGTALDPSERALIQVRPSTVLLEGQYRDFATSTLNVNTQVSISGQSFMSESFDAINNTSAQINGYTDGTDSSTFVQLQAYRVGGLSMSQIRVEPGQVILRSDSSTGANKTTIQQSYTDIIVKGETNLGPVTFKGIEYDVDYSSNFVNRSLVDKEYVDNAVTGGGATQTLAQTLVYGNETNTTDIALSNSTFTSDSDSIRAVGNTFADAKFSFEDYGGGAWAPTIRVNEGVAQNFITVGSQSTIIENYISNQYSRITTDPLFINLMVNDLTFASGSNINMTSTTIAYNVEDSSYYSASGSVARDYTSFGNDYISPNPGFPDFHRRGSVNTLAGAASGYETFAEVKSENLGDTSFAYIRATDMGGAYPANRLVVGNSTDYTQIEQNLNQIMIESSNTGFYGIRYDQDWSANFVNRSLVDKAYVDAAVTGGPGATPSSLSQVLLVGNTASTDIDMNQYQIQNVSVIDADGNVGIQTINMINASLLTLMYNT